MRHILLYSLGILFLLGTVAAAQISICADIEPTEAALVTADAPDVHPCHENATSSDKTKLCCDAACHCASCVHVSAVLADAGLLLQYGFVAPLVVPEDVFMNTYQQDLPARPPKFS